MARWTSYHCGHYQPDIRIDKLRNMVDRNMVFHGHVPVWTPPYSSDFQTIQLSECPKCRERVWICSRPQWNECYADGTAFKEDCASYR